jgi:hypothetical protein
MQILVEACLFVLTSRGLSDGLNSELESTAGFTFFLFISTKENFISQMVCSLAFSYNVDYADILHIYVFNEANHQGLQNRFEGFIQEG